MATPTTGTAFSDQSVRSPNFFNGRLLTGGDLSREQKAWHDADAQLGLAIGPGIGFGLEVTRPPASPSAAVVQVSRGVGVAPSGRVLRLGTDPLLTLVQPAGNGSSSGGGSAAFDTCSALPGAPYVAGDGVFLLTLAPATYADGAAPVLALDAANTRCSTDVWVEAVQLRLLRLNGYDATSSDANAVAQLRNRVAYDFLREDDLQAAHRAPGTMADDALATPLRAAGLTDCDVPLAIVYMVGADIVFVDGWAVRRRLGAAAASTPWSAWLGDRAQALAEARFLQFQAQIADTPALLGAAASAALGRLPPAGVLPGGTDWRRFLGSRAPVREVALAAGDAPDVLAGALAADAIALSGSADPAALRVYRVGGGGGPLLFVRDGRALHHAEQVWLDGTRAGLPGVSDVQKAIDELRRRSCLHVVFRPSMAVKEMQSMLPKSGDVAICFEAGEYRLDGTLVLEGLGRATLHGAGARLVAGKGTTALRLSGCDAADIEGLALEGTPPARGKAPEDPAELPAVIEIDATPRVRLSRLDVVIHGARTVGAAAVRVGTAAADTKTAPLQATVQDCELSIGLGQVGLLVLNPAALVVRGNRTQRLRKGESGQFACVVSGERIGALQIDANALGGVVTGILVRGAQRAEKGDLKLLDDGARAAVVAERVVVADNVIELDGQAEDALRDALSDRLATNRLELKAAATQLLLLGAGISVGAAQSLRVTGNGVSIAAKTGAEQNVVGVLLQGAMGAHVALRDNRLVGTAAGIVLALDAPEKRNVLWLAEANVGEAIAGKLIEASEAILQFVTRRDNVETA